MDLISQVFRNLQSEGLEMLLSHDAWRQRPMLALGSKPGTRMALPLDMTTSSASDLSSSTRTARGKQEWAERKAVFFFYASMVCACLDGFAKDPWNERFELAGVLCISVLATR